MAKGVSDVGAEFEAFATYFRGRRPDAINAIAQCDNGFEGWLKFEFFLWLAKRHELRVQQDIRLEYRVALAGRAGRASKRCDLWVMDADGLRSHYVEFKAFFNNRNRNKMLSSAARDLRYMADIDRKAEPATGSAILIGAGFTRETWADWAKLERLRVTRVPVSTRTGSLSDQVHWNAWVRTYR